LETLFELILLQLALLPEVGPVLFHSCVALLWWNRSKISGTSR